jgi:hypothetical protein
MHVRAILATLVVAAVVIFGIVRWSGISGAPQRARIAVKQNQSRALEFGSATHGLGLASDLPESDPFAPGSLEHAALFNAVMSEIVRWIETKSDYAASVRWLDSAVPGGERDRFTIEVVRALLAKDPTWAANFTLALSRGAARYAAIAIVADEFVRRDPEQSLQWAQSLPVGATRSIALERITDRMADNGLAESVESLTALPPSLAQDDALCSLAAHWARRDAAGVLRWAENFPDSPLKPRVIASIGFELAQADPVAALRLAQSIMLPADLELFRASVRWSQAAQRLDATPIDDFR